MSVFVGALIFYFGAIVGSFLNVVILRLPQGQKLSGRSRCASCGRQLSAWELFPLLSFLFLSGRCRRCQRKISRRYFVIEAAAGLLFLGVWHLAPPPASVSQVLILLKNLAVVSSLLVIFVIDFEHYLILDSVAGAGLVFVLLLNFTASLAAGQGWAFSAAIVGQSLLWGALAALPFYLLWLFSKGRWMGFGDVKLALLLGVIFGWPLFLLNFALGFFLGGLVACLLLLSKRKTWTSRMPLGTFLSVGALLTLFFGPALLAWYLSIIGL